MSRIILTASSRVGCVRSNNEDMILAYDRFVRSDVYTTEFMTENIDRFVIAIADGMGGHKAGEVASADTLNNLLFFLNDLPCNLTDMEFRKMMISWLNSVNHMLNSKGHENPSMADMGTTLVGLVYYNGRYYWMNCGDSRLYRQRDGQLLQLTTDHSLNNVMGERRHSNIITNCIGAGCQHSYIDICELTGDILPGDTYLVCSDGLNDMLPDAQISNLLASCSHADELSQAAIAAGGFDNVSVCIIKVE